MKNRMNGDWEGANPTLVTSKRHILFNICYSLLHIFLKEVKIEVSDRLGARKHNHINKFRISRISGTIGFFS